MSNSRVMVLPEARTLKNAILNAANVTMNVRLFLCWMIDQCHDLQEPVRVTLPFDEYEFADEIAQALVCNFHAKLCKAMEVLYVPLRVHHQYGAYDAEGYFDRSIRTFTFWLSYPGEPYPEFARELTYDAVAIKKYIAS